MAYQPYEMQLGCKYVLTAPSGLRAAFNDSADADYVGVLQDISGLDSADVREAASELVEADGGQHGFFFFGRRPITMTALIYNHADMTVRQSRIDKARRVIKECMRADGILSWQNLPTASNPQMQTWVRQQQPFRIAGSWNKTIQMALVSQYTPLFSTALNTSAVTATGGAGVALENKGDYPSYPVVTINATSTNPTITDGAGGTFFTTGLILATGEVLVVDMLNHTAAFTAGARNGQSGNRYIDFSATTTWPRLTTGTHTWGMTGGGSGTFQVAWRDSWG